MDEAQLKILCDWLRTAPALAGVKQLWVDGAPAVPGTAGLFPAGVQVTERRVNLLGEVREKMPGRLHPAAGTALRRQQRPGKTRPCYWNCSAGYWRKAPEDGRRCSATPIPAGNA